MRLILGGRTYQNHIRFDVILGDTVALGFASIGAALMGLKP
jgi:hypothetical protein